MDGANERDQMQLAEADTLLTQGRTLRRKVLHRIRQRRYLQRKAEA